MPLPSRNQARSAEAEAPQLRCPDVSASHEGTVNEKANKRQSQKSAAFSGMTLDLPAICFACISTRGQQNSPGRVLRSVSGTPLDLSLLSTQHHGWHATCLVFTPSSQRRHPMIVVIIQGGSEDAWIVVY